MDAPIVNAKRMIVDSKLPALAAAGSSGRKLILQLCEEAPGTALHSLRVCNLMEKAGYADDPQIQAAVLLHDIGKLVQPLAFAENQTPPNDTPPVHSCILTGHVDFGIMLCKQHDLGPYAEAAILQHHGTRTCVEGKRFEGHTPTMPFTVCLMMANILDHLVEANKKSPQAAASIFRKIHLRLIQERQLDHMPSYLIEDCIHDLLGVAEGCRL